MCRPLKIGAVLILIGILGVLMASADIRGGSQEISEMALGILEQAGVGTDTPSLLEAIRLNSDPTIRWIAIDILGQRQEKRALEPLRRALKGDPDRIVREAAALALARMGEPTGVAALKEFLRSPADSARQLFTAARLAELGEAIGYRYVCEAARSESSSEREMAAENLVPFIPLKVPPDGCDVKPEDLLLSLIEDKSPQVRYTVLLHLPIAVSKGMDRERARSAAQKALSDPEPKVREEAEFVIDAWRLEEETRKPGSGGTR